MTCIPQPMTVNYTPVGGAFNPITTGAWYPSDSNATGSVIPADGAGSAVPIISSKTHTFTGIACNINTVGTAGAVARMALYADNGSGYPGALIQDFGTVSTAGSTGPAAITSPFTLQANQLYWLVMVVQGAPLTQAKMVFMSGSTSLTMGSNNINGSVESYTITGLTGSTPFPTTFPSSQPLAIHPFVMMVQA